MPPSNSLRSLRDTRERFSFRKTRPIRKAALGRKLNLERLEDRTVPTLVTILGSHLATSAGDLQAYYVDSVTPGQTGDITVDVSPGTYTVKSGSGNLYGTFTTSAAGVVAADGALSASAGAIDFDLSKLTAVTVKKSDLATLNGTQENVYVENEVVFQHGDATAYLPTGTFGLATGPGELGLFRVAANASGTLAVTNTTGAVAATGNLLDIDLTKLAAVTVNANDYHTASGLPENLVVQEVVGLPFSVSDRTDTVYLPAGTFGLITPGGALGFFTITSDNTGNFTVTGTTGAVTATGNVLDVDLTKLAPVLVRANDFHTAAGVPETVSVPNVVGLPFFGDRNDTVYLPAGTFSLATGDSVAFGTFDISANGAGAIAVSGTTGAIRATGNEVTWSPCDLANVRITPNPGVQWNVAVGGTGVNFGFISDTDTVLVPLNSTYTLYTQVWNVPAQPVNIDHFTVGPSGPSATQLPQNNPLVTLQLVPCQDATTTTVTASANPSMLNQTVTFTANVSAQDGDVPTGTVQFLIDGVNFGSPVTLTNGSAGITTAGLTAGPHTIQAVYGGNSDFLGSSGSLTQNVQYCFNGFLPPLSQNLNFALNRTIPIKWQLCDFNGTLITNLSAVTSLQVAPVNPDNSLEPAFNPTPVGGTSLRNDGSQYIFNWQTKGITAGTYEILLTLSDGTLHTKVLQLSKNGSSSGLTTTAAGGTSTAPGGLLGGDITLYVDNTNGDLTADELARIQDAVTAADAVTEPYGVAVTEVTDPTLADVTLNMDITSAVGGYADGVLGCTTDAGQITIINGWNFYAGSDATQIGSAQYDFETVVMHELGHALGLGHSTDSTSVMYATLNTGAVNRTLTTADLNVADSDTTGACGLHAAAVLSPAGAMASTLPTAGFADPDAYFVALMNGVSTPGLAPNALLQARAHDAIFADPLGDVGTTVQAAGVAVEKASPIFGGSGLSQKDDELPVGRLDARFDFLPADGSWGTEI